MRYSASPNVGEWKRKTVEKGVDGGSGLRRLEGERSRDVRGHPGGDNSRGVEDRVRRLGAEQEPKRLCLCDRGNRVQHNWARRDGWSRKRSKRELRGDLGLWERR